jgi:hypothetical protein
MRFAHIFERPTVTASSIVGEWRWRTGNKVGGRESAIAHRSGGVLILASKHADDGFVVHAMITRCRGNGATIGPTGGAGRLSRADDGADDIEVDPRNRLRALVKSGVAFGPLHDDRNSHSVLRCGKTSLH